MESMTETELTDVKKDELHIIGKLVNSDGVIKIDIFNILLDFENNKVYATSKGTIQDLINAKNGNIISTVFPFSMQENEMLDELIHIKYRGVFCQESYATSKCKLGELITTATVSSNPTKVVKFNTGVKYSQWGIYYELNGEWSTTIDNFGSGVGFNWVKHDLSIVWTWQRRCSSVSGNSSYSENHPNSFFANGTSFKKLIYSNVRALKHYNLTFTISSPISTTGLPVAININN